MKRTSRRVLGAILMVIGSSLQAQTKSQADQSYAEKSNLAAVLADTYKFVGQTVTAGVTGYLTQVQLNASMTNDFAWVLDIQQVDNGIPNGTVLSSTVIPSNKIDPGVELKALPSFPLPLKVDLPTPVFFKAGESFAIVLHPQDISAPPVFGGSWLGTVEDGYTSGTAVVGSQAGELTAAGYDLHFLTLMSSTPEPSAPDPDVALCITLKGIPITSSAVTLIQPNQPNQQAVTDGKGCYEFPKIVSGKPFNIRISSAGQNLQN